ncbi:hypothetical protein NM688_g2180 [Phlebia brevispora]|uniref:Uncharacterized protein n=1 Tax=Phlebia brevispora TaxID=194682 RepID=A0ACC1T9L9_9APHY|nr:hypothetical protein NM688_g2180 [Phlebia brevispora]
MNIPEDTDEEFLARMAASKATSPFVEGSHPKHKIHEKKATQIAPSTDVFLHSSKRTAQTTKLEDYKPQGKKTRTLARYRTEEPAEYFARVLEIAAFLRSIHDRSPVVASVAVSSLAQEPQEKIPVIDIPANNRCRGTLAADVNDLQVSDEPAHAHPSEMSKEREGANIPGEEDDNPSVKQSHVVADNIDKRTIQIASSSRECRKNERGLPVARATPGRSATRPQETLGSDPSVSEVRVSSKRTALDAELQGGLAGNDRTVGKDSMTSVECVHICQSSEGPGLFRTSEKGSKKTPAEQPRARSVEATNMGLSTPHVEHKEASPSNTAGVARRLPSQEPGNSSPKEAKNGYLPAMQAEQEVKGKGGPSCVLITPRRVAEQSYITTPGNSTVKNPPKMSFLKPGYTASLFKPRPCEASSDLPSKTVKPQKKTKMAKPPPMTPPEYARWLASKLSDGELRYKNKKILEGTCIYFYGGDFNFATPVTQNRMTLYGATLLPEFDQARVTHIITESSLKLLLRSCGVKSLKDIRADIPILRWSWVASGMASTKGKCGYYHDHAAFSQRVLCDPRVEARVKADLARVVDKGKGKAKARDRWDYDSESEEEYSKISRVFLACVHASLLTLSHREFTPDEIVPPVGSDKGSRKSSEREGQGDAHADRVQPESGRSDAGAGPSSLHDPLAEFYEMARAEQQEEEAQRWADLSRHNTENEDEHSENATKGAASSIKGANGHKLTGFQCDKKGPVNKGPCPNQDIVDQLTELKRLHETKLGDGNSWRVYTYSRVIPAIRAHPTRITTLEEARKIPRVGDKTAMKIMEIVNTGKLTRIAYERTDDVKAIEAFMGIYGVGINVAHRWYAQGCRTLDDIKARKNGIKLSEPQEIGLKFYDDINSRMPRQEAQDIFDLIKPIALDIDPRLEVEIMGSFRRGKADCGDIDIMITRPTDDGRTHGGVLRYLLHELRKRGIVTEDLCVPEDWDDLELVYRGLCRKDSGSRRRRIDFLAVPYESRGAARLYYTEQGDDIFNRSMRLKANKMGYSLNQRGLYHGVVRNPSNRLEKLEKGQILASKTEREIFDILGVPWQEPHERARS